MERTTEFVTLALTSLDSFSSDDAFACYWCAIPGQDNWLQLNKVQAIK